MVESKTGENSKIVLEKVYNINRRTLCVKNINLIWRFDMKPHEITALEGVLKGKSASEVANIINSYILKDKYKVVAVVRECPHSIVCEGGLYVRQLSRRSF